MQTSDPPEGGGILQSLRRMGATAVSLLQTRLELLATELDEERVRFIQLLFWTAGALFFLAIGVVLLAILVVALFWDTHRIAVLGALTVLSFAVGAGLALGVRRLIENRPAVLSATLGELARDRDQLTRR